MAIEPHPWHPSSWRQLPALQQPSYEDEEEVGRVYSTLSRFPPMVTSWEVEELKAQLAAAARGEQFLLQGGDCAEVFADCSAETITNKLKILLQMSLVLVHSAQKRVIRVGRIAGQYAKPRSSENETRGVVTLPAYRGDLINSIEFTEESRRHDPANLLRGYSRAAMTLNFIRGLIDGGFADLHHPEYWSLGFVRHSPHALEYQRMVESIGESLRFMETLAGTHVGQIDRVDFFTSHEGLHLLYEQAQTRQVPRREGWYNLSTHFPWIGLRTSDPEGSHVEFFRGIRNPIGLKVGPKFSSNQLEALLDALHPDNEPGRLTLIHRFGRDSVRSELERLIEAVRRSGKDVVYCCDPMHGNTRTTSASQKTRYFSDILEELESAFEVHAACGSHLGGVHFELTGENVTECVGGAHGPSELDLRSNYRSQVDPRLNYEQALELAMLMGRKMASLAPQEPKPTFSAHSRFRARG